MKVMHYSRSVARFILTGFLTGLFSLSAQAQNPFEDAIKQLNSDNVRGYLQPFVNSFGANLNSGFYHTAKIDEMGISIKIDFVGMAALIGDAEKTYSAVAPFPFDQTPVETATLFGEQGAVVRNEYGIGYKFQNGQVKTSYVPTAVPQLTIGNVMGTEAVIRYVPIPELGDFPKVTLFGIGVRHSISRYFPGLPVDLAAGVFYNKFTIGDILDAKAFNLGAQVSKSFSVLTLYGGLGYETSSVNVSYTYNGFGAAQNSQVSLDLDGENKIRATAGLGLTLAVLNLNADISVGKVTVASGSLGFGF